MKKLGSKKPTLRSAKEHMDAEQLANSRVAKICGTTMLFLVPPQFLNDHHALRHLTILNRIGNDITLSDGKLKAKYWSLSLYDPSDWFSRFKKIDKAIAEAKAV